MTKEETIRTLQDIAWLGAEVSTDKNVKAVSIAIACVNGLGYIKDYLDTLIWNIEYEKIKTDVDMLMHVKAFIEGYEKGVFDD